MSEEPKKKEDGETEKPPIILHQFPRAKKAPSPSPYPLKVETFLRMNKLKYTSDFKDFMGPKGKCPWITDEDGKAVPDSQFIIEHLTKKHNIKMVEHSSTDAAVCRAMRSLLEDNLYFVALAENYVHGDLSLLLSQYPRFVPRAAPDFMQTFIVKRIKANLSSQAKAQGLGRHSREEVRAIGMSDMEALSNWLGEKQFMFGSEPCDLDCSAFGFLAIFFYIFPEDYFLKKETEEKFPNLRKYTDRIKEQYWPDWDELLAKD